MVFLDHRNEGRGGPAERQMTGAHAARYRTHPWPKRWNGVLTAAMVGGDLSPFLSHQ